MSRLVRCAALGALLAGCNSLLNNRNFTGPDPDGNPGTDCAALGKPPTTLTGTVFQPNQVLPVAHALVYAPTAGLADIPDGPSGATCASGAPAATTFSDSQGKFRLENVPAGDSVRVVMQVGKWRREITVPNIAACSETALDANLTRLPRDSSEGHIPHIAISTGLEDSLECLARDIGIAGSEITSGPTSAGRVRLYVGNGTSQFDGGATFESRGALTTAAGLASYDAVLLACEGRNAEAVPTGAAAMLEFVNAGGWLWLTHDEFTWLKNAPPPWSSLATFTAQQMLPTPSSLLIDKATSHGQAFAAWVDALDVSGPGTLDVELTLSSCHGADPAQTQRVLLLDPADGATGDQMFTWDASAGGGRLVFSDVHLAGFPQQTPPPYPMECESPLPQELAVMYQLFDAPACTP